MRKQLFANVLTSLPTTLPCLTASELVSQFFWFPVWCLCAKPPFLLRAGNRVGLRTRRGFGSGCHEQSQPSSFTSIGVLDLRQPRLRFVAERIALRGGDDVPKPSSQLCYTRARRTPLTATQSPSRLSPAPAPPGPSYSCRRRPLQLFLRLCVPAACWNTARCADSRPPCHDIEHVGGDVRAGRSGPMRWFDPERLHRADPDRLCERVDADEAGLRGGQFPSHRVDRHQDRGERRKPPLVRDAPFPGCARQRCATAALWRGEEPLSDVATDVMTPTLLRF